MREGDHELDLMDNKLDSYKEALFPDDLADGGENLFFCVDHQSYCPSILNDKMCTLFTRLYFSFFNFFF
jgi:hypothetical protein